MIDQLRKETESLHKEIEKNNLASGIMAHNISLEEYKLLLLQNYVAYYVVESAISAYYKSGSSDRLERLERDLLNLNINTSEALSRFQNSFNCNNHSEALGAAYVIEGSALGGMYISRELENCSELKAIEEHHFFNGDRNNVKPWNNFLKLMRSGEFTQEQKDLASGKAKETFRFFGEVFNLEKAAVSS